MTEAKISKLERAAALLPDTLYDTLYRAGTREREAISELRVRRGRFFSAVTDGREHFFTRSGELTDRAEYAVRVTDADVEHIFRAAFRGSVHAFPRELAEGFITCEGGNRVGFCGSAVLSRDGGLTVVKEISSVNIRIARELPGCSDELYERAFGRGLCSLIIASPPCGGKTTILRDLCRRLGGRYKVSLIDERSEIAAVSGGIPQNDVGLRTDVFSGYTKAEAITTAVRVMSPDVIICDEIGTRADGEALSYAANSGVRLVCTCHSPSFDDLRRRPIAGRLIEEGVFGCAAILGTGGLCGKLTEFRELTAERVR